jgi:tetratricopeptide (TPR) repeat protein
MQMRSRRQELHSQAVKALEKIYGDEQRLHYAELAYHAELGDLREKAQRYYALAGKTASEAYQNKKGIDYLTRALAFTPLRDMAVQFDLLVERIELYNRVGNRPSQLVDLQTLEILAVESNDQLRLIQAKILHARYSFTTGDYPGTIEVSRQVVELSKELNQAELALGVYIVWSQALFRLGRLNEAMKYGLEGLELSRLSGSRVEEGRSLSSLGLIALESKESGIAQKYLEEAVSIARETKERTLEARSIANLANSAAYFQKDYLKARSYYELANALNIELGDRYAQGHALGNIGWVCGMLGDYAAARRYNEQTLIIAREMSNVYLETFTLMNLSKVAEVERNEDDALFYAVAAVKLARTTGDKSAEAWSHLYLGYAHMLMNEEEKARTAFEAALNIRRELGQTSLAIEPIAGLIEVALQTNDDSLARRLLEELLSYLSDGEDLDAAEEPLRVYLACCDVLKRTEDPNYFQLLDRARQLLDQQVSKINNKEARLMFIENVPWRRAIQQYWLDAKGKN